MPLGLSLGRPLTPLRVATSAFSPAIACRRASFSASSRSARASSSARGRPERLIFPEADMAETGRVRVGSAQPRQLISARAFAPRTMLTTFFAGDVFDSQGATLGQPWQRLSPVTVAQKARRGYPEARLIRTGRTLQGFRSIVGTDRADRPSCRTAPAWGRDRLPIDS